MVVTKFPLTCRHASGNVTMLARWSGQWHELRLSAGQNVVRAAQVQVNRLVVTRLQFPPNAGERERSIKMRR